MTSLHIAPRTFVGIDQATKPEDYKTAIQINAKQNHSKLKKNIYGTPKIRNSTNSFTSL